MDQKNNKFVKITLWVIAIVLIIPLVIPIPPPEGTLPIEQLADPDSSFIQINEVQFHYKNAGSGDTALVFLHGFGASLYSWREVMPVFAEDYAVFAYDRPAFGLTERPVTWTGENPYSTQASVSQLDSLLYFWGLNQAVLVGNSAGGRVAMEYALLHPERVTALILVSPAAGPDQSLGSRYPWLVKLPQVQRLGPLLVRRIANSGPETIDLAWHNPANQPADTLPLYTKPLKAENWDLALWNFSTAVNESLVPDQISRLDLPILLITGDDDRIVPTENTIALQDQLPGAELVILPDCGHVPQEECPDIFIDTVIDFLNRIDE